MAQWTSGHCVSLQSLSLLCSFLKNCTNLETPQQKHCLPNALLVGCANSETCFVSLSRQKLSLQQIFYVYEMEKHQGNNVSSFEEAFRHNVTPTKYIDMHQLTGKPSLGSDGFSYFHQQKLEVNAF